MRITRDSLLQAARTAADQQLRQNRRMVCIYLTGSLLTDEPLLGHTTDIDLFFIHDNTPEHPREIIRLSDEIHLDIAHFAQSDFRQPREQRSDPWLSPFICNNPIILHDTQHWFEFTQSSICAQYGRPEYTLYRARNFYTSSRQLWFDLKNRTAQHHTEKVYQFLKAMEKAANAVASLTNRPMTERRFLLQYPGRAEAIGNPGLADAFIDLLMPPDGFSGVPAAWLENWEEAFIAASKSEKAPIKLDINRLSYYKNATLALNEEHPFAALWPVIKTWTLAASVSTDNLMIQDKWSAVVETMGMSPDQMDDRIQRLDEYLDSIDETLDAWSKDMGIVQE
ncbi:MAG: hypothetical protein LLG42_10135 [Chloroflexi bacterium]|nr:hypothetical protein [Chloroflexota bacterium]